MSDARHQFVDHYKAVRSRLWGQGTHREEGPRPPAPTRRDWPRIETLRDKIRRIELEVADSHMTTVLALRGDCRVMKISAARHELWFRLHHELGLTFSNIAQRVGRDHTTIMYGVRRHAKRTQQ